MVRSRRRAAPFAAAAACLLPLPLTRLLRPATCSPLLQGKGNFYDLGTLLFFARNINVKFTEYFKKAREEAGAAVTFVDRKVRWPQQREPALLVWAPLSGVLPTPTGFAASGGCWAVWFAAEAAQGFSVWLQANLVHCLAAELPPAAETLIPCHAMWLPICLPGPARVPDGALRPIRIHPAGSAAAARGGRPQSARQRRSAAPCRCWADAPSMRRPPLRASHALGALCAVVTLRTLGLVWLVRLLIPRPAPPPAPGWPPGQAGTAGTRRRGRRSSGRLRSSGGGGGRGGSRDGGSAESAGE